MAAISQTIVRCYRRVAFHPRRRVPEAACTAGGRVPEAAGGDPLPRWPTRDYPRLARTTILVQPGPAGIHGYDQSVTRRGAQSSGETVNLPYPPAASTFLDAQTPTSAVPVVPVARPRLTFIGTGYL